VNTTQTEQVSTKANADEEASAFEFVKGVVNEIGSKFVNKMRLQNTKNCVLINYRNCMVCGLVYNSERLITNVRFMGATIDTRKKATNHEFCGVNTLEAFKDDIARQVEFIDWWYLNPKAAKM
jgi:hypothetical protein